MAIFSQGQIKTSVASNADVLKIVTGAGWHLRSTPIGAPIELRSQMAIWSQLVNVRVADTA